MIDLELMFLLISVVVNAALGVYSLLQRWKMNKLEERLMCHPEKVAIYDAVLTYIANVRSAGKGNYDSAMELRRETKHAELYFPGDEIPKFIEELYQGTLRPEEAAQAYGDRVDQATQEDKAQLAKKWDSAREFFDECHDRAKALFAPYVRLT